jgi:membrane associated rhomboid family serine protease
MGSILDDIRNDFLPRYGAYGYLILINSVIFLGIIFIQLASVLWGSSFFSDLLSGVNEFFALSTHFPEYLFKPWSIITYNFIHYHPFHILFNLIILYFFGAIGKQFFTNAQVFSAYIQAGIAGGVLVIVSYAVLPYFQGQQAYCVGASAGIYGLMVATATLAPNYPVYLIFIGRISLKWVALLYVVLDFIFLATGGNKGGHITHIGGALWGYFFIYYQRKGVDLSYPWVWLTDFIVNLTNRKWPKATLKVIYPKNRATNAEQELNRILDKIKVVGYDKLTAEEKNFLDHISKEK